MRGACMYELEKETRAVRSCLCDKQLKYQKGGRVRQPTVHYDRERESDAERERQRSRKWEEGNNICLNLLLHFYLPDSPFILSYSDLLISPCEA